jgi:hypothetical protein
MLGLDGVHKGSLNGIRIRGRHAKGRTLPVRIGGRVARGSTVPAPGAFEPLSAAATVVKLNGSKIRSGSNIFESLSSSAAYATVPRHVRIAAAARTPSKTVRLTISMLPMLLHIFPILVSLNPVAVE